MNPVYLLLLLSQPSIGHAGITTAPTANPTAALKLPWTDALPWKNVADVTVMPGGDLSQKITAAQDQLVAKGGGVLYFPAGTYAFADSIRIKNGIIFRGAPPKVVKATDDSYALGTRFVFPQFKFSAEGNGTPIDSAFKGIVLAEPGTASNCGIVHIDINRGHVHFDDDGSDQFRAGSQRLVYGCILRNTAVADAAVPNPKIEQKPWQRFTRRHFSAIDVRAHESILVANNRLPKSGEDNFTMNGYVLLDNKRKPTSIDGVVFDYDNRPGIYVNHYNIGGAGGMGPDGTPESHPQGFRKGAVIVDNFVYSTGRTAIGFCGDGTRCERNIIRFASDIWRPTATGQAITSGSSTNDNRAVEMRGWRWIVAHNDYLVFRNWAFDKKYKINDGEGLMHEDHANSTIKDSVLSFNKGNTYLSLYKPAGIDGLVVEGNQIRLGDGKQTIASGAAIYVVSDRNKERFPIANVTIKNNVLAGGGITIAGQPGISNLVTGNRYEGPGSAKLVNAADAKLKENKGLEVMTK